MDSFESPGDLDESLLLIRFGPQVDSSRAESNRDSAIFNTILNGLLSPQHAHNDLAHHFTLTPSIKGFGCSDHTDLHLPNLMLLKHQGGPTRRCDYVSLAHRSTVCT